MGNQILSGNRITLNDVPFHEWGGKTSPTDQFGGRDVISIADTFGEAYLYYRALNPETGKLQRKVSFIKRVTAQGVPVLIGAGYYLDD